jgi:hypothetical protein
MKKAAYIDLPPREINNRLAKRKLPKQVENHIRDTVLQQKAKQKISRLKKVQHTKQWREVLNPARYERKTLHSMVKYEQAKPAPCEQRLEAYEAYLRVIDKAISQIERCKLMGDMLPAQASEELQLENKGRHWVDWVPISVQRRVQEKFLALPKARHRKYKCVFARIAPTENTAEHKERLLNRTRSELQREQAKVEFDPTTTRKERITRIKAALKKIEAIEDGAVVPKTWHALMPPIERPKKKKQEENHV